MTQQVYYTAPQLPPRSGAGPRGPGGDERRRRAGVGGVLLVSYGALATLTGAIARDDDSESLNGRGYYISGGPAGAALGPMTKSTATPFVELEDFVWTAYLYNRMVAAGVLSPDNRVGTTRRRNYY